MGKISSKESNSRITKKKRRLRSSNSRYLKPGALAQLRYNKVSSEKSCTDLGKKRVALFGDRKLGDDDVQIENKVFDKSPLMLSPADLVKQNLLVQTPKTPCADVSDSDSRLESLPMDLLVKILCHLHHDQLRAVFHVSRRIRRAVVVARQSHFNFTTPDRSRQELLSSMTPQPTEHWPFLSRGDRKGVFMPSPHTPKAPRHGPRPPSRIKITEMKQIAAVLFQDSTFPSRCIVPSALSKPLCKSMASNRALFSEDELCQAVENKLR
ncbi:hypothetical protein K2173_006050 [Erythroxylum novogranatense]|uniref:F-box domain-containing protein n=1 Tax=Erythroxylum novogranatense TaxID=1862640 RepID=A0AAV8TE36_9ROSI|nr:hypothetical protein K2173_006050 [Erythroxylum novogranatense]